MGKITKLMLTAALIIAGVGGVKAGKLYATYGKPADQGSWNAETQVYSWTQSYSNLMTIFTFSGGELSQYKSLHLTTSDYVDCPYRVCFMNGGTAVATISFYSAGQKDLVFADRDETKDLDLTQITHISFGGASNAGSVTIVGTPYLQKPTTIEFDETGVATIGITDIDYDTNLTFDDQTGVMTSNGQGTFSVTLDNEDFSSVTKVELLRSGDDIVQTLQITDADNGVLNTWYSSKYVLDFTSQQSKASKITKLAWNCNAEGTMTITGIRITASVIYATDPHYTTLTTDMFHMWTGVDATATQTTDAVYPAYNLNTTLEGGGVVYGGNVPHLQYADLTDYDKIVLTGTSGMQLRVLLNRQETAEGGDGDWTEVNPTFDTNGNAEIDLTTYKTTPGYAHLNSIKLQWGNSGKVTSLQLYKADVSSPYDYVMSGSGVLTASATAALADEAATSIDATGITKATALTTANPNCLIVANDGMVTNANNVIVSGTCANLVLTDGYAFKAPADFTATEASYTTTINTEAKVGTLCLPFAATIPSGVQAYTLTYTGGNAATAEAVENTIPANTPVLLNGEGEVTFSGSGAAVSASATNTEGAMTGVFEATIVPEDSYVLQKQDDKIGFFKVNSSDITAASFRAYVTARNAGSRLNIVYAGEATGISTTLNNNEGMMNVYDLQGRRVAEANSTLSRGLYIVNGKKIMVK